jgi:hypothetical protein
MSVSTILGINEVGENQTDKYITINDAIAALEQASNANFLDDEASAAAVEISEFQATRYALYEMQAKTGAFDLVFPSTPWGNNADRLFFVWNNTAQICTVKAATGAGTTAVISPNTRVLIKQTFEDMTMIFGFSGNAPYDFGFYFNGTPTDTMKIQKWIVPRAIVLQDDFAGARGHCDVNPASPAIFSVRKNGAEIGTITIDTLGAFTFATTGTGPETFAAGDRFEVVAPTPEVVGLENVSVSFTAERLI